MSIPLQEITNRYAKQFHDFANLLENVNSDSRSNRVFAKHFILQIQHRAANAMEELRNLPKEKE